MDFDTAFDRLIGHEGGYTNNPADPGGETMWGVTLAVARANGYTGPMRDMSRDFAKTLYRALYWMPVRGDFLSRGIAFQVFDAAVNSGVSQASKWLQAAVGAEQDGVIGPLTLAAATRANDLAIALAFNAARLRFYTNLATWPSFGRGWARRVATNLSYAREDI